MRLQALHRVALLLLAIGCGDDGEPGQAVDAAPPIDARILEDAARQACTADSDDCANLRFERVCDVARAYCVECLASADCQGAEALGPTCVAADNSCRCGTANDCQGKSGGAYCHPIVGACGCLTLDDCPANSACEIEPYLGTGIRRCRPL